MDTPDLVLRQVKHFCKCAAQRVDALRMGPNGQRTCFSKPHCARWSDCSVHLEGPVIDRIQGSASPCTAGMAVVDDDFRGPRTPYPVLETRRVGQLILLVPSSSLR